MKKETLTLYVILPILISIAALRKSQAEVTEINHSNNEVQSESTSSHNFWTTEATTTKKYYDPRLVSVIICDGGMYLIRCHLTDSLTTSYVIKIIKAEFGRGADTSICPHPTQNNKNCWAPNSTQIVQKRCDGWIGCHIKLSEAAKEDPCPYTFKYMILEYMCVPSGKVKKIDKSKSDQ